MICASVSCYTSDGEECFAAAVTMGDLWTRERLIIAIGAARSHTILPLAAAGVILKLDRTAGPAE